jgi:hypothetical protein
MFCHQNAGRYDIKTANKYLKHVTEYKYLRMMETKLHSQRNLEQIKYGNVCYYSLQNYFSYFLVSKNVTIERNKTIIVSVVMHFLHDVHEMNAYRAGHVCVSVHMI